MTALAAGPCGSRLRQKVDKGITVLLERNVLGRAGVGRREVARNEVGPRPGVHPHNVDEAWAFYVAEGNGPPPWRPSGRATSVGLNRAREVVAGLTAAQQAAGAGDAAALDKATGDVEAALDYVFYLAMFSTSTPATTR